jgi:hypothetical protein
MLASIMRIVQREQRGRSMDLSDGPEEKIACGMALPCIGRERAALSVTDNCRLRYDDQTTIRSSIRESVVNIAHIIKVSRIELGFHSLNRNRRRLRSLSVYCRMPSPTASDE